MLLENVSKTIESLEINSISEERKAILQPLIDYLSKKLEAEESIRLNFICTHNSARSQMAEGLTNHFFKDFYGTILFSILDILPTISLLIYLLSKEKIEDDFIKLLRLEAYQITTAIFLSLAFIFYVISPDTSFGLDWFLSLFMILFLIIFFFKKQAHS